MPYNAQPNYTTGLKTNIVSYWDFESLPFNDSVLTTANNLTNTGCTVSATGKPGNACNTGNAGGNVHVNSNSTLQMPNTSMHVCGWWKFNVLDFSDGLLTKVGEYALTASNGTLSWSIVQSNSATKTATASGTLTTGVWYFIDAFVDIGNLVMGVQYNLGGYTTTAITLGLTTGSVGLYLGGFGSGIHPPESYQGLIDSVGIWKKRLSASELTFLNNSGSGRSYSEFGRYSLANYASVSPVYLSSPGWAA